MTEGAPYDLAKGGVPRAPRLRGDVVLRETTDQLIDALLADLFLHAGNCVRVFGDFHLAVHASPAIEPVLRRLLYDPAYREFPWVRTRAWLLSENATPGEPSSAWASLRDLIIEQSGIPREQGHWIPSLDRTGVATYEALLREHLGWRSKGHDRLDVVLTTLGEDGDVGLVDDAAGGLVSLGEVGGMPRVAMSLTTVNAARLIAVFAAGECVRDRLREIDAAARGATEGVIPALRLKPAGGDLRWYLDHAACGGVEGR